MEDKRMLKEEELEKVVGGVAEKNQINLAADAAVAEIKIEVNTLNDISQSGGLGTKRNKMLSIYGDMLSKFTELQAITLPTMDDVYRIFTMEYVAALTGRPKEIYDKFKSAI